MRHSVNKIKLGRNTGHRKALMKNMVRSFLENGQMCSTHHKIKACRPIAEKTITLIKKDTLAAKRKLFSMFQDESYIKAISAKILPMYKERNGGYTRIIKNGFRNGDGAQVSIIQLV